MSRKKIISSSIRGFFFVLLFIGSFLSYATPAQARVRPESCKEIGDNQEINTKCMKEADVPAGAYPLLKCFGYADCNGAGGERCCKEPALGEVGGRCYSGEHGRKRYAAAGMFDVLDGVFPDSCKWWDVVCHAKKGIGDIIKNSVDAITTKIFDRNDRSKLPDAAVVCQGGAGSSDNAVPYIDDPSYQTNPAGYIIQADPADPRSSASSPLCWCIDENTMLSTGVSKLCSYAIGLNLNSDDARNVVPSSYQAFIPPYTGNNLKGDVKKAFDDFMNDVGNIKTNWYTKLNSGSVPSTIRDYILNNKQVQSEYIYCLACASRQGYPSALGCLPYGDMAKFIVELVFGVGFGVAGSALILGLIYSAIQLQISQGDSAQIQKAQKLMRNFLTGFLLIVFSIFLLRFVGVNILRIYGMG